MVGKHVVSYRSVTVARALGKEVTTHEYNLVTERVRHGRYYETPSYYPWKNIRIICDSRGRSA